MESQEGVWRYYDEIEHNRSLVQMMQSYINPCRPAGGKNFKISKFWTPFRQPQKSTNVWSIFFQGKFLSIFNQNPLKNFKKSIFFKNYTFYTKNSDFPKKNFFSIFSKFSHKFHKFLSTFHFIFNDILWYLEFITSSYIHIIIYDQFF